ncbi:MAG: phage tail protein [Mollicutes bacterium]|nr:phage tail protein [Mollicutes bacterium]MCI7084289.1 phage tail protein [Mycoplasmatota bacterium]
MISVYESNEKIFNHNGLKVLHPRKCDIFKEDNGDYYIELEDTIDNIDYYQANMIIKCPTPFPEGKQLFRIINPEIKNNYIYVKAKHVYFDASNYIILDNYIVDKNCNYALEHLNSNTDKLSPFTTTSNINTLSTYRCVRKSLEEAINIVIERWGGHLVRNNFNISIFDEIGVDRGVQIKYSKNLKELKVNENWDDVVTKLLPVGKDGLLLPEKYITLEEQLYDIPFTKVISFEQELERDDYSSDDDYTNALIADLRNKANIYLENNKLPKVNYSLSANLNYITDVGDTVYLEHPKIKLALKTNVISVKYDVISQRFKSIEFGNFKSSLKSLIQNVNKVASDAAKEESEKVKTILQDNLNQSTDLLWSVLNKGYVIKEENRILIVDKLPLNEAQNCLLFNYLGIGFSNTGVNGTFTSAWRIDGTLDMQNINVINLTADLIKGGVLRLGGINNSNGLLELYDENSKKLASIDKNGLIFGNEDSKIKGTYSINGIKVEDQTGNLAREILFVGYDDELNESVVRTDNLFVKKYLQVGDYTRYENYTDSKGHKGTGAYT